MPTTWPHHGDDEPVLSPQPVEGQLRYDEGVHVGHRGWLRAGTTPALAFGSGLGYTTWRFDDLAVRAAGDGALVHVTLTNTGVRTGTQTVQVYLSRPDSAVTRPRRWLAGFARVSAAAGGRAVAEIAVDRSRFAHWSVLAHDWTIEPGTFTVHVGANVLDTPLAGEWTVA